MNRTIARLAVVGLTALTVSAHPRAQGTADPWYGLQPKPQNFDEPKVFTGTFQIQLPKGWHLAPGHTNTIFSSVEHTRKWETGGAITLEYMSLPAPVDPTVIAGVADRELKEIQLRELRGKQFGSAVKVGRAGPIILVQYDRPGISGTDDHVAQYSIPVGQVMYRLVCIAPTASVEKYRPMFAHVAASFQPAKAGSGN
jgi:hypothetical protein